MNISADEFEANMTFYGMIFIFWTSLKKNPSIFHNPSIGRITFINELKYDYDVALYPFIRMNCISEYSKRVLGDCHTGYELRAHDSYSTLYHMPNLTAEHRC